jgi:hypothetical protein
MKILKISVLALFVLFIFVSALATNKPFKDTYPASTVLPLAGAESEPPLFSGPTPMMYESNQPDCADINPDVGLNVIQIDQWGATYYDYQKNGSMGRMIAVGPAGHRHMLFHETRGVYGTSYPRWITYNCKSPLDTWLYGTAGRKIAGGANINAGYGNIAVLHNGREVAVYHQLGSLLPWSTTLAVGDAGYICNSSNAFVNKYDLPDSLWGVPNHAIWPNMGILYDANVDTDYIHVVATEGKTSGGDMHLIYMRCHLITGDNLVCETPTTQPGVTSPIVIGPNTMLVPNKLVGFFGECPNIPGEYPNTISVIVATSPVSRKAAIVFTNKRESGGTAQNNDVFYFESTTNGNEWLAGTWPPTFANGELINITNYPTSAKERAYTDVAACYDYNDNLHIVWNAQWYDSIAGLVSMDANLYHWSVDSGISTIASGYWDDTWPGGWCRNVCKMSISALDPIYHPGGSPDSVFLFVTWTQFNGDNMPNPDNSIGGYTNGEIYAAVSKDAGQTWTPGFNLTGTHTPDCAAGTCLSEHWSSLAENMYDGNLHIEYVCDRDAGGIVQDEGGWTDNPMMYMHVEQLPATAACGVSYTLSDPSSFSIPPIKVSPTGNRTISLELEGIYNLPGQYEVTCSDAHVSVITNPSGSLNPGDKVTVEALVTCGGVGFINTTLDIIQCKNSPNEDTIPISLMAVCSNDYFECRRDPKTIFSIDNGVCSLWTSSNTVKKLWDRRISSEDMSDKRVVYAASPFAATIVGTDTVVGIEESDKGYTGARDTINVSIMDESPLGTCRIRKVSVDNTYLWFPKPAPQNPVWYWLSINQQIITFEDKPGFTCDEWKKEQIIKQVWVKFSRPPNWWPSPGAYSGHTDIYYGYWADIDAPSDTGCNSCNIAGWDDTRKMIWQHGRGLAGEHPEYSDHYVGLALTDTTGAVVDPYGVQNVKNNVYIYPHSGWVIDSLYQLAATSGVNIHDPDSVKDRTVVLTAGKIDAAGALDTTFMRQFILIEATIKGGSGTGLYELQTHMDNTRNQLIPLLYAQNHSPMLHPIGNPKFNEGDYIVINVGASDLDGDSLIFTASNLPQGAYFNGDSGVFLWIPTYSQRGTYPNIHFEVSDGRGGIDYEDITIEILNYPHGDFTGDGIVNSADISFLINYLFVGGPPPPPQAGSVNCDGSVNSADVVYLINYLFLNGAPPCAPPSPKFILPKSSSVLNGSVWVSAENLSNTPIQQVKFQYSSDSLVWTDIEFDEPEPSTEWDVLGNTFDGAWNTEPLSSGLYWLRVIMSDSIHALERTETIPAIINKNPNPFYSVSYDSLTGMVTFDGSPSSDTDGTVIGYSWVFCDSTFMKGRVVQKQFDPGDSCLVSLIVFDNYYNWATYHGITSVSTELQAQQQPEEKCKCLSIKIIDSGEIPKDSDLDFGNTSAANPKGNKKLGPVDHKENGADGKPVKGMVKLYFMVEAEVEGNPDACSTGQWVARTFLYDGKAENAGQPGYGPNGEKCEHKKKGNDDCPYDKNNKCNPQNPPAARGDLCPDDYFTDCQPTADKVEGLLEKKATPKGGVIRWLDAPGPKVNSVKDSDFSPAGMRWYAFFLCQVINHPECNQGCEKCFIYRFKYDKDKNRQDVDGDGNADPPKINSANCPP